ncbi:MAG: hypothetical protein WBE32_03540 [Pseudolabrys sp.]
MSNMLAGSRTRTGKPKIEKGHQPKSMALRSLSIVEAKSNLAGLPRRDQDEPSSPVNAGLKLTHLSVGLECASMLPSLVIENPCAAVADLSPTKRAAVIECFNNRGLHKCNGYWCGPPEGKHISGVTVADLARDGVFTVIKNLRHGSAQLTERGQWFAQTLIAAPN